MEVSINNIDSRPSTGLISNWAFKFPSYCHFMLFSWSLETEKPETQTPLCFGLNYCLSYWPLIANLSNFIYTALTIPV